LRKEMKRNEVSYHEAANLLVIGIAPSTSASTPTVPAKVER
jgi:hypothetical protein